MRRVVVSAAAALFTAVPINGAVATTSASPSAAQTISVGLRREACAPSALSASTAPIEFVVRNLTSRVAAFAVAARPPTQLAPHASARLRRTLSTGRYRYVSGTRGQGSLLVVAASNRHRIAVATGSDGRRLLVDRLTGEPLEPSGATYTILGSTSDGQPDYHVTFNVGTYDPPRADRELARMHDDGYNTLRVCINGTCSANCLALPGGSLRARYIANLVA